MRVILLGSSAGTYTLHVHNLHNSCQLAFIGAGIEENDTAELDLSPHGCDDCGVSHIV